MIERTSGTSQDAAGAQIGSGEKEIRIPLSEERVQVEKKPAVNEEIRVGKREVQDTKRVSDEVRHEELRTESEGDVNDVDKEQIKRANQQTRKSA